MFNNDSNHPNINDTFHVIPSYKKVKQQLANNYKAEVAVQHYTTIKGTKRGTSNIPGPTRQLNQPADEKNGDISPPLFRSDTSTSLSLGVILCTNTNFPRTSNILILTLEVVVI